MMKSVKELLIDGIQVVFTFLGCGIAIIFAVIHKLLCIALWLFMTFELFYIKEMVKATMAWGGLNLDEVSNWTHIMDIIKEQRASLW